MLTDPEGILEAVVTAMALEDVDSTVAYFDQNADYVVVSPSQVVFPGRDAIARRLNMIVANFHVDRFRARTILPCDEGMRTLIDFTFRHKATGETIDGTMRVIASSRDGRIVRWREYQDADRVEAFLRLVSASMRNAT